MLSGRATVINRFCAVVEILLKFGENGLQTIHCRLKYLIQKTKIGKDKILFYVYSLKPKHPPFMAKDQQGGLLKTFGLRLAIVIVMSSIIGSGVFKKVAPMAEGLHSSPLVILAWVLAGIIVLFGVLSIAEL